MTKRVLIVKNITHEGPGALETLLCEHGIAWHSEDLSAGGTFPDPRGYSALVVLGGPLSANDESPAMLLQLRRIEQALHEEIPSLGICLGIQCLVKAGGGKVVKSPVKEIGFLDPEGNPFRIDLTPAGKKEALFGGLGKSFPVFQLHGETVELASSGMELLATGKHCPVQAVRVGKNGYGLQCHFELTPAMFSEWCDMDADLKRMNRGDLMEQFETIREEYLSTGLKLMHNFLRISELV